MIEIYLFLRTVIINRMLTYYLFLKISFWCYHRLESPPEPGTSNFHSLTHPYTELSPYFGNQKVPCVVGLHVGECLEVGSFFILSKNTSETAAFCMPLYSGKLSIGPKQALI